MPLSRCLQSSTIPLPEAPKHGQARRPHVAVSAPPVGRARSGAGDALALHAARSRCDPEADAVAAEAVCRHCLVPAAIYARAPERHVRESPRDGHVVLLLANPELIGALVFALKCGQLAFAALRHLDHGAVEGAFVLMVFFVTNKFLGGSTKRALAVLVIGYAFAWVGHFFFELNKPATFVYPTFSLVCDFLMWAEIVTGMTISF